MEKPTSKIKANAQKNTLLKTAASQRCEAKFLREYFFLLPQKNYFFKFPSLLKFFKTATAQPTQNTAKPTTDMGYSNSTDRTPAGNTGLAKVAVQCSADTFAVNQNLVLRINICGENRHLRQARNR